MYSIWANGEKCGDNHRNQFDDKFERVRFIILAGEDYFLDDYMEDDGIADVIDHLMDQEYDKVVDCLISSMGGKEKLLHSLKDCFDFDPELDQEKLRSWYHEKFSRDVL